MADGLITQTTKNLIGGVSQQTPSLRRADQCAEQVNCRNDVVDGMGKRYNTTYLAEIAGLDDPEDYVFQYVDRDQYEKYILAVKDGDVKVFDKRTGYEYLAIVPNWAKKYLAKKGSQAPNRTYQLLNTIDSTFILNKTTPVKYLTEAQTLDEPATEEARRYTFSLTKHAYPKKNRNYDLSRKRYWYEFTVAAVTHRFEDAQAPLNEVATAFLQHIHEAYPSVIRSSVEGDVVTVDVPANTVIQATGVWRYTRWDDLANKFTTDKTGSIVTETISPLTIDLPSPDVPSALWYIKQADYSTGYTVILDGNAFNITTPDATADNARAGLETGLLTEQLRAQIDAHADFSAERFGSVIYIKRIDEADFTIEARDDLSDRAAQAIKEYVVSFDDLPPSAPTNYRVEVRGSLEADTDPYHVVYRKQAEDGRHTTGYWEETVKYGSAYKLNPQTMPVILKRKQDDIYVVTENPNGIYFEIEEGVWGERVVGDDITAPFPSFCSEQDENGHIVTPRHILSMTYYRNRMAFVSEDNIVFSEAGEFLNFFPTTVITVLDADVIDISIPFNDADTVDWLLEASNSLFLFTPRRQLRLTAGEVLKADTIEINVVSRYAMDTGQVPISEGAFIYFWMRGTTSSQLMEYYPDGDNDKWVATQVTAHVPNYVQGEVVATRSLTTENTFLIVTRDTQGDPTNTIIVYDYLWSEGTKKQNAWHKWTFEGEVIDVSTTQDEALVLIRRGDQTLLERMNLSWDDLKEELGHPVYLDSRQEVDNTFVLPAEDTRELHEFQGRYFVGYPYEQKYVFSQFYPRTPDGLTLKGGRYQVKYLYLDYSDTSYFEVDVTREGRVTKTDKFTGRIIGSVSNILNEVPVESGQFQARVQSRSDKAVVSIKNGSVFDAVFQTAEIEGMYVTRSRRT